jgi:hypothetical protein
MKRKNRKKLISLFIKHHRKKFNSLSMKKSKSLKVYKKQSQLKKIINNHLTCAVFQGIIRSQKRINSFIGENHNIQI